MATGTMYSLFWNLLAAKDVDVDADTFKVMLATSDYSPDQDAHEFKSDVTDEVSGSGYSAGGVALTGVSFAYNSGANTFKFSANDTTFSGVTIASARYAIVYDDSTGGSDSSKRLVGWVDFEGDVETTGADLVIDWDTSAGIWQLTVSA